MPSKPDPVKIAKDISKATGLPLPKVASIMQKHPLDKPGMTKAFAECRELAAKELDKNLKQIFPF